MATGLLDAANEVVFSEEDMATIEFVLGMRNGRVLDFDPEGFDRFVIRHWKIKPDDRRYAVFGVSSSDRLRGILRAFDASSRADVLQKFLDYRKQPRSVARFNPVSDSDIVEYEAIIRRLSGEIRIDASLWTGLIPLRERARVIKVLAPVVLNELEDLIERVESKRLNDPETARALETLRELHAKIGELISAIEREQPITGILSAIERKRDLLVGSAKRGAKIFVIAPAMTLGLANMLAWMLGTPVDTTMVTGVYATLMGTEALGGLSRGLAKRD